MSRINLCPNPALKNNSTGWFGGGSGAGRVTGQTGFPDRTTAYRDASSSDTIGPRGSVSAGQTYTFSGYTKPTYTGSCKAAIHWYRNGAWYSSSSSVTVSLSNGVVTRATVTATCPNLSGTWTALWILTNKGGAHTSTQLLYERGNSVGSYFDGDTDGASWDGTAGNSTSTLDVTASLSVFPDTAGLTLAAPDPTAERQSDQVLADAAGPVLAGQDATVRVIGEGPPLDLPPPEVEPVWTIYARGADLLRTAQVDDYSSLDMITRFNAVGTWELRLDRRSLAADAFSQPGAGIEVWRDDFRFMAGPVRRVQRERDRSTDVLVINGTDDNIWLERRLASPQPGTSAPPYSTSADDVRTGASSTVIWQYVNVNLGPGAISPRRLPNLTMADDPGVGDTVTGRARWDNLLEFIAKLAVPGGEVGFKIVPVAGESSLEFVVYEPDDKSSSIVFSEELGNLLGFRYEQNAPEVTYVIGGGDGEGTARTIYEGQDPEQVAAWGRIEKFTDIRTTTVQSEITQEIDKVLAEGGEKLGLELSPVDTSLLRFGTHYDLGDRVSVVIDGVVISEIVREVRVKLSPQGPQTITPVLGTPGRQELLRLLGAVRDLAARTRNLERR